MNASRDIIGRLDIRIKPRFGIVGVAYLVVCCALGIAGDASEPTLAKAAQLFGSQLSGEHRVFRLNDDYVIWLSFDTRGDLLGVDVTSCLDVSIRYRSTNLRFALVRWPHPRRLSAASEALAGAGATG